MNCQGRVVICGISTYLSNALAIASYYCILYSNNINKLTQATMLYYPEHKLLSHRSILFYPDFILHRYITRTNSNMIHPSQCILPNYLFSLLTTNVFPAFPISLPAFLNTLYPLGIRSSCWLLLPGKINPSLAFLLRVYPSFGFFLRNFTAFDEVSIRSIWEANSEATVRARSTFSILGVRVFC